MTDNNMTDNDMTDNDEQSQDAATRQEQASCAMDDVAVADEDLHRDKKLRLSSDGATDPNDEGSADQLEHMAPIPQPRNNNDDASSQSSAATPRNGDDPAQDFQSRWETWAAQDTNTANLPQFQATQQQRKQVQRAFIAKIDTILDGWTHATQRTTDTAQRQLDRDATEIKVRDDQVRAILRSNHNKRQRLSRRLQHADKVWQNHCAVLQDAVWSDKRVKDLAGVLQRGAQKEVPQDMDVDLDTIAQQHEPSGKIIEHYLRTQSCHPQLGDLHHMPDTTLHTIQSCVERLYRSEEDQTQQLECAVQRILQSNSIRKQQLQHTLKASQEQASHLFANLWARIGHDGAKATESDVVP